jgi:hypothetical protein
MHNKIRIALAGIIFSCAGVVLATPAHAVLDDGQALAKMGLLGFMGVCICALVISIIALLKFIVKILLPLKDALIRFTDSSEKQADQIEKMRDDVKACGKNG